MYKKQFVALVSGSILVVLIAFASTVSLYRHFVTPTQNDQTQSQVLSAQSEGNTYLAQAGQQFTPISQSNLQTSSGSSQINQPNQEQQSCYYPCWLYNGDEDGCIQVQRITGKCGWCDDNNTCLINNFEYCN